MMTQLEQLLKDAWILMGSDDSDAIAKWFEDEKAYQKKKEEIQLDYNIGLISDFMNYYKDETEKEIPEEVFDKFFNV